MAGEGSGPTTALGRQKSDDLAAYGRDDAGFR